MIDYFHCAQSCTESDRRTWMDGDQIRFEMYGEKSAGNWYQNAGASTRACHMTSRQEPASASNIRGGCGKRTWNVGESKESPQVTSQRFGQEEGCKAGASTVLVSPSRSSIWVRDPSIPPLLVRIIANDFRRARGKIVVIRMRVAPGEYPNCWASV
jgi:hypothetical protein